MKCFLILICISASVYSTSSSDPRVRTNDGQLIGTTHTLSNGETVYAFLGVPYAAPPVGPLRFEEPKPVESWDGDRNASTPSKMCVQFIPKTNFTKLVGEEDCLYLDIYTPRLPSEDDESDEELKPVMIHMFDFGHSYEPSRSSPDSIMYLKNMLWVKVNYRKGMLGFFSSGDKKIPGNNGLKDQLAALRWIQENILNFGGDPAKVTVSGVSGAAVCVHMLLFSPQSQGLFKNAMMSGGSSLVPWTLRQSTVENSISLASSVECPTSDSNLMLSCLKNKSIETIYKECHQFYNVQWPTRIPFTPVVEAENERAVVSEHPYESLKKGNVTDVPVMVGTVEQEGSLLLEMLYDEDLLAELNDNWNELAPRLLLYDYVEDSDRRDRISSAVRDRYFGEKDISTESRREMLKLLGDRLFNNGIIESTKLHSAAVSENLYCFKLYYEGTGSFCDHQPGPVKENYGTCHADDQFYYVRFSDEDNTKSKIDLDMASLGRLSVTTFLKTGNPNIPELGEVWQSVPKNGTINCFGVYTYTQQKMLDIEDHGVTKFWRDVLESEY